MSRYLRIYLNDQLALGELMPFHARAGEVLAGG